MRTIQTDYGPVQVRSLTLKELLDHGDRLAELFRQLDGADRSWFDIIASDLLPIVDQCCSVESDGIDSLKDMEISEAGPIIDAWIDEVLSPKALSPVANLMKRMGVEAGLMSRIAGTGASAEAGMPSPTSSEQDGHQETPSSSACKSWFQRLTRRSAAAGD